LSRDLATNANVVTIITALVVGYFFLDPPWRWLILIPAAVIESLDIIVWLRWRKKRSIAGAEGIIGTIGIVVSIERPDLVMVKAKGQLWRAEAAEPVQRFDDVMVTAVDGIRLKVARVEDEPEVPEPPR
jgi:membrane protein implicated in regulation of membrane protease activity